MRNNIDTFDNLTPHVGRRSKNRSDLQHDDEHQPHSGRHCDLETQPLFIDSNCYTSSDIRGLYRRKLYVKIYFIPTVKTFRHCVTTVLVT